MSLKDKIALELVIKNLSHPGYIYTDLFLPAKPWEIEDAKHRARIIDNLDSYIGISIVSCVKLPELENIRLCYATLMELNLFAKRLQCLSMDEVTAMRGVFIRQQAMGCYKNGITMKELIDLTYGLDAVSVICAGTDEELGEIVIENDLNENISKMSDECLTYLNKAEVGRAHRKYEKGEYVNGKYVATAVYFFPKVYEPPSKEQLKVHNRVAFALKIAPETDSIETVHEMEWIYLPIDKKEANEIARRHNMVCIEECVCYEFVSAIPGIESDMLADMRDFDKLNCIAKRYMSFPDMGKVKLKAVIQKTEPNTLNEVQKLIATLDDYEVSYYDTTANEYAKRYLAHHMPLKFDTEYLEEVDGSKFGNRLLNRLGASITDYGIVSAENVPLLSLVPYDEPEQEVEQKQNDGIGGMKI